MMLKLTTNTKKAYFPILFDKNGTWLGEGPEYNTIQDAENHASAMVKEYIEEVGEYCYAHIENRIIPIYTSREGRLDD